MKITWERTVIGGQTTTYDFHASVGGVSIGRIIRVNHGPSKGRWTYSYYPGVPVPDEVGQGSVANRVLAIEAIERCYALRR